MSRLFSTLVCFCLLSLLALGASSESSSSPENGAPSDKELNDACTLYLAPSTLDHGGLGVFTATARQPGQVLQSTADICIPFIDLYWHQPKFQNPYLDYFWHGKEVGILSESKTGTVDAACLGLESVLNCQIGLANVLKSTPTYDQADLHRAKHAGAGARSPYGTAPAVVARAIPAGGELFQFAGEEWLASQTRLLRDKSSLATPQEYQQAHNLLKRLGRLVYNETLRQEDLYQMVRDIYNQPENADTLNALPDSVKQCFKTTNDGGEEMTNTPPPPPPPLQHTRSVSWLQEHGRCIDHIVKGRSTLQDAGNGAFARHDIKKGQVITTSPVFHFAQDKRPVMEMYNITKHDKEFPPHDDEEKDEEEDEEKQEDRGKKKFHYQRHLDEVENDQIALNYCFGHEETTLLLCPYGPGVNYINHRVLPNVAIRWARDFSSAHNPQVVEMDSLGTLSLLDSPTLAFDYVATRDIKAGDELFLDYGHNFDRAWYRYQGNARKQLFKTRSATYASGYQWNEAFAKALIRTQDEQAFDPYPDNIQVRCHYDVAFGSLPSDFRWHFDDYGYPCSIFDRFTEEGETLYTVDVEIWPEAGSNNVLPNVESVTRVLRTDIPRQALRFFDVPGTSDLHLSGTFRHWIGIPDDMLPDLWRNLEEEDYDEEDEDYYDDEEED